MTGICPTPFWCLLGSAPTNLCQWHDLPWDNSRYSLYCAVIVKRVDARTRAKTSLNELLRPPE